MPVARAPLRRGTVAFSGWVFDCAVVPDLRILLVQSLHRPPPQLLWVPVQSLPWTSPVFHHAPGELRDMTTVAVPKRRRRRQLKTKVPFVGPRISCPSISPSSNTQANLPELFAILPTTQQEADQGDRRCRFRRTATAPSHFPALTSFGASADCCDRVERQRRSQAIVGQPQDSGEETMRRGRVRSPLCGRRRRG
ncbi:hypothetical protein MTO96_051610 [Rhipicephalus appendiculatus]